MRMIYKIKVDTISKKLLFLLIFFINIRIPFFHLREILYFLFIIFSLQYGNYKKIGDALLLASIWSISVMYNFLIPGSNIEISKCFETILHVMYLFLLCFSNQRYKKTIIQAYLCSTALIAIVTVSLWIVCFFSVEVRHGIDNFISIYDKKFNSTFMKVAYRSILGFSFFHVYYVTSPCLIPSLAYCYIKRLMYKETTRKNALLICLYSVALFFSGTRAHLMVVFLLLLFYICFWCLKNNYSCFAVFLILATFMFCVFFAFLFLNDGTGSSLVKKAHEKSYFSLFKADFLRTLFFGWGVGSSFYTDAIYYGWTARGMHGGFTYTTELSHLELVRRFGFISTLLIFVYIWGRRGIIKSLRGRDVTQIFYLISILAFILTACTNPYLIESVGFCALLFYDTVYNEELVSNGGR